MAAGVDEPAGMTTGVDGGAVGWLPPQPESIRHIAVETRAILMSMVFIFHPALLVIENLPGIPPGRSLFIAFLQIDLEPHFILHVEQCLGIPERILDGMVGVARLAQVFEVLVGILYHSLIQ